MGMGWGWETHREMSPCPGWGCSRPQRGDTPVPRVGMLPSSAWEHPSAQCEGALVAGVGMPQSLVWGHPSPQQGDTLVPNAEIAQSLTRGYPSPQGGVPRSQYGGALDPRVGMPPSTRWGCPGPLLEGASGCLPPWCGLTSTWHLHIPSLPPKPTTAASCMARAQGQPEGSPCCLQLWGQVGWLGGQPGR